MKQVSLMNSRSNNEAAMPDAHAPMRNFLRFLSGEIPDILLRMVAVSSSGFSNIGWLLLISVSHFSYCLSFLEPDIKER